jgi:hypothetical protein
MSAEQHRSDLQQRLETVWANVERIRDATDPAERARAASDTHSALGHAIDHVNGLLRALELPAIEVTAGSAEGIS